MTPVVVLVGAPGAGKTTVGTLLAQRLGVDFRDTDREVEARFGKSVADVFVDHGEDAFREAEAEAVLAALEADGVVSLGGGAILRADTRTALHGHRVVLLDVGLADAVARVGMGAHRPVLALNPRAVLRHLLEERAPFYAQVATATVPTSGREPDAVATDVMALL